LKTWSSQAIMLIKNALYILGIIRDREVPEGFVRAQNLR